MTSRMERGLLALVAAFLLVVADGCAAHSASSAPSGSTMTASVRAEVDSLNRAMERAFNRGELSAVAAFYSDDARLDGSARDFYHF